MFPNAYQKLKIKYKCCIWKCEYTKWKKKQNDNNNSRKWVSGVAFECVYKRFMQNEIKKQYFFLFLHALLNKFVKNKS